MTRIITVLYLDIKDIFVVWISSFWSLIKQQDEGPLPRAAVCNKILVFIFKPCKTNASRLLFDNRELYLGKAQNDNDKRV